MEVKKMKMTNKQFFLFLLYCIVCYFLIGGIVLYFTGNEPAYWIAQFLQILFD